MPDSETSKPEPAIAPPRLRQALAPFRHRLYTAIWLGTLVSSLGVWIQSVAAAWAMTMIAGSPDLVASVQSAASLPVFLFSLVGGVLADVIDRRLAQVIGQGVVMAAALALALCDGLGWLTPWLLLTMTFLLGIGSAIRQPAFQASVTDLVPREIVPAAVALNGINFNIARAIGPGIGGVIVALASAQAAFLVNAVCNLITIAVLLSWRGRIKSEARRRESVLGALTAGLREVASQRALRRAMIRVFAFCLFASALWALLPLVVKHDLAGDSATYGLTLGCLGCGAVLGGGLLPRLRHALSVEALVDLGAVLFALATAALALLHTLALLVPLLVVGGVAWLIVMSSFSITIQLTAPGWVKARVLAIYFTAMFGSLALGSWLFGWLAAVTDVRAALLLAAFLLAGTIALRLRWPMPNDPTEA